MNDVGAPRRSHRLPLFSERAGVAVRESSVLEGYSLSRSA